MRKPYVVYWNNIPTPYTIVRFAELARRDALDFEAWFTYPRWHDREWELEGLDSFPHRFLPSVRKFPYPAPLLGRRVPDLLVSQYGWPWFVAGWGLARARRIRHVLECEITFDAWAERRWWKELAKRAMFRSASGVAVVGQEGAAYARALGSSPERIYRVDHVLDVDRFIAKSAAADRDAIRARLGLRGTTFVYVGRLWWGKGLDTLLGAYSTLEAGDGASLLIVGSGPEEERLRAATLERGLVNVVFAGFHQQQELPELYAAGDVFVFPTLGDPWGLVVEEAMASGLPVVSTRSAGEINERISEGETGWVVPPADTAALTERMRVFVDDPSRAQLMGAAARESVRWRTPERWADEFEAMVREVMKQ